MKAARDIDKVSANGLRALGSLLAATKLGNGQFGEFPNYQHPPIQSAAQD